MRPEHHRRGVRTAGADADDVANGVDGDGEGELAHPFNEQIAPGAILVAEREATIASAGQGTDPVEGRKPLEQPIAVDPRQCRHLMSLLCEWRSTVRGTINRPDHCATKNGEEFTPFHRRPTGSRQAIIL